MSTLLQDLKYGFRMLAKNPGFTAVAVVTLALGIGATVAIFSVVYGVLLRPLPYSQPDRLVELNEVNSHGGHMNFADPNFADVRASSQALDGVAEYSAWLESVAGASEPTRTMTASVSRDFFPMLRVQPMLGRGFAPGGPALPRRSRCAGELRLLDAIPGWPDGPRPPQVEY